MNLIIRPETPDNYYAVEELTREAFWEFWEEDEDRIMCNEHLLVHKLRSVKALVPELNCVAVLDGQIVGHIIYTKSWIESEDGTKHDTLTFGPLSVKPEFQSRGIGRALMQHTFEIGRKLGFPAVLIFGIPDYYPRVGFRRAAEFGITTSDGAVFDPFMVYLLYEGALDGIHGKYYIDSVYDDLTEEETLEFDKRFPEKKLHEFTPVDVLISRLEPEAANAIKGLNIKTLDVIKSKSEREISSLPGMDDNAIKTIRAVMKEHKFPWGTGK
ncbi:MAG: N-acetyltransferase [Oscillospiraceae bacterium]|nr:N-acetyltransferase [Oscillospiraceae bacterium]